MIHVGYATGLLLSFILGLTGCGGGGGGKSPPPSSANPPTTPGPTDPPPTDPPPTDPPPTTPEPPVPPPANPQISGLDARPSNKSCLAPARASGSLTIGTEPAFPNLSFRDPVTHITINPIAMVQAPGDSSRWFVAGKVGVVRVFDNQPDVSSSTIVLDIDERVESSCAECGLLGMAFHPNFPATPRVYLTYTTMQRTGGGPDTRLAEFTSRDGGRTLDPDSERTILTINKPGVNHHGGHIAFGRDGFLYFGVGDGNGARIDASQRMNMLLGKMIRIDINGTTGNALYRIPADNPFASSSELCGVNGTGSQDCPEIYAWGIRNPWRWSFDRETGDIWLGDVGKTDREEVNRVVRGGNYGWRCYEGTLRTTGVSCDEPDDPQPPVAEYGRSLGRAVTGGYVYRGTAIPALVGRYVFGDFVSGNIWDIPASTQPTLTITGGLESGLNISAFGEGHDGELYVVNMQGNLHRITAAETSTGEGGVPERLSATGCVDLADATKPAGGLIPYAPNAEFWSDSADKARWLALPDGEHITVASDGDWDFPNGTVLMKNFRLDNRLIETRLFMRHPDGVWAGYSYEWNAQGSDATLVRGGKTATIGQHTWIYPSEAQCLQCHTSAAGGALGPETAQLATNLTYPQTGRTAHQLSTLNAIDTFAAPMANPAEQTPYPDPHGADGTLEERARAYLHANCSQCHRPNGPTTSDMDLRYNIPLAQTNACDAVPVVGDLGISNARLIAPGAAARSVIPARMNLRGVDEAMPPIGLGARVDTEGLALIRAWINSLAGCE
jgi:uncharacterized repeat protein (TIGR03806 family)